MEQNFTETQKEIVARKLGYEGPMNMFDKFLSSDPAAQQRYGKVVTALTPKMRKGGVVKKFGSGGVVTYEQYRTANPGATQEQYNAYIGMVPGTPNYIGPPGPATTTTKAGTTTTTAPVAGTVTPGTANKVDTSTSAPTMGTAPTMLLKLIHQN